MHTTLHRRKCARTVKCDNGNACSNSKMWQYNYNEAIYSFLLLYDFDCAISANTGMCLEIMWQKALISIWLPILSRWKEKPTKLYPYDKVPNMCLRFSDSAPSTASSFIWFRVLGQLKLHIAFFYTLHWWNFLFCTFSHNTMLHT